MKKMLFSAIALVAFTVTSSLAGEMPKENSKIKAEVSQITSEVVDGVIKHSCMYAMYSNGSFVGYAWLHNLPDNESCASHISTVIDLWNN